jgi:hypothetical protein
MLFVKLLRASKLDDNMKGENEMKKYKNKIEISTIALILILTFSAIIIVLPTATAQDVRKASHAVCGVNPNPVGVNQEVLIWLGITDFVAHPKPGWGGLTVTVRRPDGQTDTLGPFTTDTTGSTGTVYTPTMVGTYTVQTHFPEQVLDMDVVNVMGQLHLAKGTIMEASSSPEVELVVQQNPIEYYQGHQQPKEFWDRPIDAQLWEWSTIAGNWLSTPPTFEAPYNDGPETSHILWTKPLNTGGLVGGTYGNHAYEEGDAYQGKFGHYTGLGNPVIINGVLYYNLFQQGFMSAPAPQQQIVAVDLTTGKELWIKNNTRLAFGQIVYWDSFNLHGAYAYLWEVPEFMVAIPGSTWHAYEPLTGDWVYTLTNVPGGTNVYGPKGEILRYVVNTQAGWMALWNSTKAVSFEGWTIPEIIAETGMLAGQAEFAHGSWVPFGRTIDCSKYGWMWNVSIQQGLSGGAMAVLEDRIIGSDIPTFYGFSPESIDLWGISTKPGQQGTLLFDTTWNTPPGNLTLFYGVGSVEDGVFTLRSKETRQWWGFSLDTGAQIWGPTEPQAQLDIFDVTNAVADGKLFSAGMSGGVYCYDIQNGNKLWDYEARDSEVEILWSNNWPTRILFITDGKLYVGHEEHSPVDPKPRGAPLIALDIKTGDIVFRADGLFRQNHWGGRAVIGDSIIATMDTYDNRIYAIGKGPSVTTISTQDDVVNSGSSALVKGTVTDIAAGTESDSLRSRFPNGVPAVSDESMNEWMLYVYKQFERPTDVTGVPVKIEIVDPDGQYSWIGTPTTDMDGNFAFYWKPTTEGQYMVIATFDGSASYYGSHAITYLTVDPAITPSGPIQPEPTESIISTEVAAVLIVAIAAIVIIAFLVLRRK